MDLVAIYKALGHPQRYALFLDLLQGKGGSCCHLPDPDVDACCVVDLTARHPLAQSTISHHLGILMEAGLVQQERRGTYSLYRVDAARWQQFRQSIMALELCRGQNEKSAVYQVSED